LIFLRSRAARGAPGAAPKRSGCDRLGQAMRAAMKFLPMRVEKTSIYAAKFSFPRLPSPHA
jgi:hypothetical protein